MFIGHFGIGFAGKKINKAPSLGTLFIAVQWLDLVWPVLVLLGVEKVNIEPGNTVFTPLNFVSYPWSHSMVMAMVWGILFALVYYWRTKNSHAAWLLCFLVFSHWILDWITHRPDLQLSPFSGVRVGLGLWNNKWATLILEILMFLLCVWLYLKATKPKNKTGTWALFALVVFLLTFYIMSAFGPPPEKVEMIAWVDLSQWLLIAWGYWIDKNRA